jgi:hypothetical protein
LREVVQEQSRGPNIEINKINNGDIDDPVSGTLVALSGKGLLTKVTKDSSGEEEE